MKLKVREASSKVQVGGTLKARYVCSVLAVAGLIYTTTCVDNVVYSFILWFLVILFSNFSAHIFHLLVARAFTGSDQADEEEAQT